MKKTILILGNITFLDRQIDNETKAIVNTIDKVLVVSEAGAEEIGELMLDTYESYLIPSMYNHTIDWNGLKPQEVIEEEKGILR